MKEFLEGFYNPQGKIELEYLREASFILMECCDCALIFQKEIPQHFLMNKLYEEWINPEKSLNRHFDRNNLPLFLHYAQETMMLITFFNMRADSLKFLDFGMGWGRWCLMAKAFGCECFGVELSTSKIKYARELGLKVISYDEIPDNDFDFINADQIFEHIEAPLEALYHLKKSLKTEGVIRISVPDGGDIKKRLQIEDWSAPTGSRNSLNPVSPLEHINCFSRTALVKMADIAGFQPFIIPLKLQLSYAINWSSPQNMIKSLIYLLYRNVFLKGTDILFRKKS